MEKILEKYKEANKDDFTRLPFENDAWEERLMKREAALIEALELKSNQLMYFCVDGYETVYEIERILNFVSFTISIISFAFFLFILLIIS